MTLPSNEQKVYDAVTSEWQINPVIGRKLGQMDNYTSKLLSFLIKKGLVESRRVVIDGKSKNHSEYKRTSQKLTGDVLSDVGSKGSKVPKNAEVPKMELTQASEQCVCGSWYRRGNICNLCGKEK